MEMENQVSPQLKRWMTNCGNIVLTQVSEVSPGLQLPGEEYCCSLGLCSFSYPRPPRRCCCGNLSYLLEMEDTR